MIDKIEKTYKGKPIYSACVGCGNIKYGDYLITENTLKAILGKNNYYLSHTYLSKKCYNKYVKDIKIKGYDKLNESCESLESKI